MSATSIYQMTAPAVMSYPKLHEPEQFKDKFGKPKGDPKYSASYVFNDPANNPDFQAIRGLAAAVAKAKWPAVELKTLHWPWTSGEVQIEKAKAKAVAKNKEYDGNADYQAGKAVLKSSSKFPPKLSGIENRRIIDYEGALLTASKSKFYAGVEVLAELNFVAYEENDGSPGGVTCYVNHVLTTNKGAKLATGASTESKFSAYTGAMKADNPTAGMVADDKIPY